MLLNTQGIVLHSLKYGDTSLIVKVFTQSHGTLSFIVQGVRSGKSKQRASLLQPLSQLDMVIYVRENKDLLRMKEFRGDPIYRQIPFDPVKSMMRVFLSELLFNSLRDEQEPAPELYDFISSSLIELDEYQGSLSHYPAWFMIQLTRFLGFWPDVQTNSDECYLNLREGLFTDTNPGHRYVMGHEESAYVRELMRVSWSESNSVKASKDTRRYALEQLNIYYRLHVTNFKDLQSPGILSTVLGG